MILVDGIRTDTLDALDRGLAYGDGIFRTMLMRDGKTQAWKHHYAKIAADCQRLALQVPHRPGLDADLEHIAADTPDCVIKMIVTRGTGSRGYAIAGAQISRTITISGPLPVYPHAYFVQGIQARVCDLRLASQPALAGIKHLNRLENVLARREWDDTQIAEGILLDGEDNVIGGTMSNLFMVRNNTLLTPDLSSSGIRGVTRERILNAASALNIITRIRRFKLNDLYTADAIFLCNSLIGIWQVHALQEYCWQAHPLTGILRTRLDQDID